MKNEGAMMEPIKTFSGQIVALPINDTDTDQIIPARYLKVTDKIGLGQGLFSDWRYNADGSPKPEFVLNQPEHKGASILIGGHNFGCGSSREHAPWALQGGGFKAVVSTYFADIFRNNSLKNGLLPVPTTNVTIDLATQTLTLPDGRAVKFPIDGFSKECLLNGVDQLGYLMNLDDQIAAYEAANPARVDTLA
jgi:3-isopropylmalate/(R)-2-methylmalate dehydratase small subunit